MGYDYEGGTWTGLKGIVVLGQHSPYIGSAPGHGLQVPRRRTLPVALVVVVHLHPNDPRCALRRPVDPDGGAPPRLKCSREATSSKLKTFKYKDASVCWVDLLNGVLVCDLPTVADERKFTFVPLFEGCSIDIPISRGRPNADEFRSMGHVGGAIKFVTVDWEQGAVLYVRDIRESQSFCERDLPQVVSSYHVFGMDEDEVIYVSLNHVDYVDAADYMMDFNGVVAKPKGHYVVHVDMKQTKVLSSTGGPLDDMTLQ
ncbi:hypothetical protein ACP4OV_004450 [Aristida adscensionis]